MIDKRIALFAANPQLFHGSLRGLEKECLRVDSNNQISSGRHPEALGSTLTHPHITTDYSEALLEFITVPHCSIPSMLKQLEQIHAFAAKNISDEVFWASSMPCLLGEDKDIPVADYGNSNVGKMKTVYRYGLGNRYGRSMQTIAGVHFNYSVSDAIWAMMQQQDGNYLPLQDYKTAGYFNLLRNFKRHYWLLIYLMGSAPVVCRSFLNNKQHDLQQMPGTNNYYLPHATSLRLGDLGYQSSAQDGLQVPYNDLKGYVYALLAALKEPYPSYEKVGLIDEQKNWQQLSTALLQIENEFYSVVRPKQTSRVGETQLKALWNRGVEYVEVRCLDVNPFSPIGVEAEQLYFCEVFYSVAYLQIAQVYLRLSQ